MTDFDLDSYAARRNLRDPTVHRMRGLDEASRAAVLALVVPLALNDNNVRDVLDLLEDIAARRGTAIAEVLESEEIATLRRRDMGRSDRIRELKSCLYRLRYPQLSAALQRIEELRRNLRLPSRVLLELPDNLEGEELTVTLRAGSAKQLRELVAATAKAFERDELEAIFAVWQESEG